MGSGYSMVRSTVSIPVGFFQALQLLGLVPPVLALEQVSIPVGFFQALQRQQLAPS